MSEDKVLSADAAAEELASEEAAISENTTDGNATSEIAERRTPRLSDPASMKTEAEIEAQIAFVKRMCKTASAVLAVAIALMLLGFFFFN